jgi:hypothetical protein
MVNVSSKTVTAFDGLTRLASGSLAEVAIAVKQRIEGGASGPVLVYDDATGRVIDIDTRGSDGDVVARLAGLPAENEEPVTIEEGSSEPRGRGRPRLGVVAREVTLLPRHWDWLNSQPSGASVALRKLVEEARRTSGDKDRRRAVQEAAYRFMSSIAGHLPGYEEALRALFAYDRRGFAELVASWPPDIRDHAIKLAFSDLDPAGN